MLLLLATAWAGPPETLVATRRLPSRLEDATAAQLFASLPERIPDVRWVWQDSAGDAPPTWGDAALREIFTFAHAWPLAKSVDGPPPDEVRFVEQAWQFDDRVVRAVWDRRERAVTVTRAHGTPRALTAVDPSGLRWDGRWNDVERDTVTKGLSMLTPDELLAVRDAVWQRRPGNHGKGLFRLFSAAVTHHRHRDPWLRFEVWGDMTAERVWGPVVVGPDDAWVDLGLRNVVHELGHAIDYAAWYDGRTAMPDLGKEERAAAADCAWRGYWEEPVHARFFASVGEGWSITDYGGRNAEEAFADAFAMWKLDPALLARVSPEAAAFFDGAHHLAWRSDPSWAACRPRQLSPSNPADPPA